MGFLDNSGDIILDAVLTDLGRQKMARGNFSITKFAVGDDEIDYGLYNKNSPSGSAYYDLEILQTPVMEAFTQTNAGINYGLLTNTATDLLYLPTLRINTKGLNNTVRPPSTMRGLFFVASTAADTTNKLIAEGVTAANHTISNATTGPAILLEAGLDTADINGTAANRTTYLLNTNLVDNYYFVYYDNRFISSILGPTPASKFNNTVDENGTLELSPALHNSPRVSTDLQLENYSAARVRGIMDGIVYNESFGTIDTALSIISGPRSTCTMLNVEINPNLSTEFSKFGSEDTALPGGLVGAKFDFLDTILYVQGANTGIQTQIPLRICKYKSA